MTRESVLTTKSLSIIKTKPIRLPKPLEQLSKEELERKKCISKVMTFVLKYLSTRFIDCKFEWMLPVIFSKSTDPLWPDSGVSLEKRIEVEIYGNTVRPTLSMIVHKMVACSLIHPKLFTFSPNVRIERTARKESGLHAYEFTQLDFEWRNATSREIRAFVEDTLCGLVLGLKNSTRQELAFLKRYNTLYIPKEHFKIYSCREAEDKYGKNWETTLCMEIDAPVWITDIPREFYDFEDFKTGEWDNYDLFLPGYGEVLSGSRREWEYIKIVEKMERDLVDKDNYKVFLKLARERRISPSAGAGLGMERLVSWIVGAEHIGETQLFPKIPGVVCDL
jgi:asparaginyl-tRNA synthetase